MPEHQLIAASKGRANAVLDENAPFDLFISLATHPETRVDFDEADEIDRLLAELEL